MENSANTRQDEFCERNNPGFGENTSVTEESGELLTEAEVDKLIDACQNPRDRAFIATMYEGALREREIQTLTWDQVVFGEFAVVIRVTTMMERPREICSIAAMPYLYAWRNDYPRDPVRDNLVFLTRHNKPFQHKTITRLLRKIEKHAGLTKYITPHLLRKSRMTHLRQQGCPESSISAMCGGTRRSGCPEPAGTSPSTTPKIYSYRGSLTVRRSEERPIG